MRTATRSQTTTGRRRSPVSIRVTTRRTFLVLAAPTGDGDAIALSVPELGDTSTVALDETEGEVLVRQAISLALGDADPQSFDIEVRADQPGL